MTTKSTLPIADVVRRTGITARTLRFYETLGLMTAQRTASGHRCYGPAELARLHQISALKKAGFSLVDIDMLLGARAIAAGDVITVQLNALDDQRRKLAAAKARLELARQRVTDGKALTPQDFCDLIMEGDKIMTTREQWDKVTERYMTEADKAHWAERMERLGPKDFNQADYSAKWADLGGRIAADLPMDPASDKARAYLAEWRDLLAPFMAIADDRMQAQTMTLYNRMDEWEGQADPGFNKAVWDFIMAASASAKAAGLPGVGG